MGSDDGETVTVINGDIWFWLYLSDNYADLSDFLSQLVMSDTTNPLGTRTYFLLLSVLISLSFKNNQKTEFICFWSAGQKS